MCGLNGNGGLMRFSYCLLPFLILSVQFLPLRARAGESTGLLGGRIGASLADFSGDDIESSDRQFKIGFTAGTFFRTVVSDKLSLQFEVNLVQKGVDWSRTDKVLGYDVQVDESISLLYADVPVLLWFPLKREPSRRIGVYVGPNLGLKLRESREGNVSTDAMLQPLADQMDDSYSGSVGNLRSIDIGTVAGFDILFRTSSNGYLQIDVRYCMGLTGIAKDIDWEEEAGSSSFPLAGFDGNAWKLRNGTFMISIGYGLAY
jgi:hypothetical protein